MKTLWLIIFFAQLCQQLVNAGLMIKTEAFTPSKQLEDASHPFYLEYKEDESQKKLLHDLTLDIDPQRDFIYVNFNVNVLCKYKPCEIYTIQNLERTLRLRGQKLKINAPIVADTGHSSENLENARILNAGSSSKTVFILNINNISDLDSVLKIKEYSRKCFTVIVINNEKHFPVAENFILKYEIFNTYFLWRKFDNDYLLYEFCGYCNFGKHQIRLYNRWSYPKGFSNELKYLSSFKSNFNQGVLKIGLTLNIPPAIFITGVSPEGNYIFSGQDYWMLMILSRYLNFRVSLTVPRDGLACSLNNFSYTGYGKLLIDRKVDLAGFPIGISWWMFQFFDPVAVYCQDSNIIISASPPIKQKWNEVFSLFEPTVFLCIFISYILTTLALYIQQKMFPKENPKPMIDVVFITTSILTLESTSVTNLKPGEQIVVGVWMLACFFVISGVFAEFTSVTATPGLAWKPVDTLLDMKENDMSWIISPLFDTDELLLEQLPELAWKSKELHVKDGLDYVLNHPREYIFYLPRVAADPLIRFHFWNGYGENPFHLSPGVGDTPYPFTLLVAKESPFRDAFTIVMLRIESTGIFMHKYIPDAIEALAKLRNQKSDKVEEERKFFTLDKMIPSFIVMAIGGILSFICLILEFITAKFKPDISPIINSMH